jgi:hypothetical protein
LDFSIVLRPSILPGEYALGYQGRFARTNGWRTERKLNQALLDFSGHSGETLFDMSRVEKLSMVAGLSVENFVSCHTIIPLRRAFIPDKLILPHGDVRQRAVLQISALNHMGVCAYFCQSCVNEDLMQYGFSYWRRMHQIIGVHHCWVHNTPLSYVRGTGFFMESPLHCEKISEIISSDWVVSIQGCEPILRYGEICMNLLWRSAPKRILPISRNLRDRAEFLGVHYGQGRINGVYFSDYILDVLDSEWLERLVPGASRKLRGAYFQPIDSALFSCGGRTACQVFVLAFAVLYKSVSAALNTINFCDRNQCPRSAFV